MKRLAAWLVLALLLFVGVAQAEEIGEIQPKYDDGVMFVSIGKKAEVRYRVTTDKLRKSSYAYQIEDKTIATVDNVGNVKGLALGETTLTITSKRYPEVSAQVTVRVIQPVKKVRVEETPKTLNVGETLALTAYCEPADATNTDIVYSSNKETVATVDENGLITAVGRGEVTITAASADGHARARVKLNVKQLPEEITFKQSGYVLSVGRGFKFKATVWPSNANNKNITWSSSDESVATVNKKGQLHAKGAGIATITATSVADPTVFGTVDVQVVVPIKTIKTDPVRHDLHIGDTVQLEPIFTPEDATPAVRYEAVNPYIVTVDENGLVTATGGGETIVKIISQENSSRKAEVTIAIHVDVTGVTVDRKGFRLPVGEHAFGMAKVRPGDATNKNMIWGSSDPSVAVVTNMSNRPRIEGLKWGRTKLTGVTVDGGYEVSFMVNVGALHDAATVYSAVRDGDTAAVVVQNHSDMHLEEVTLWVNNEEGASEEMTFAVDIAPGQFSDPLTVSLPEGKKRTVAVAGWKTDTGYYTNDEVLKNTYRIASGLMDWVNVK